jgi:hypothetical protein
MRLRRQAFGPGLAYSHFGEIRVNYETLTRWTHRDPFGSGAIETVPPPPPPR